MSFFLRGHLSLKFQISHKDQDKNAVLLPFPLFAALADLPIIAVYIL
jgi:hypothetical protein